MIRIKSTDTNQEQLLEGFDTRTNIRDGKAVLVGLSLGFMKRNFPASLRVIPTFPSLLKLMSIHRKEYPRFTAYQNITKT